MSCERTERRTLEETEFQEEEGKPWEDRLRQAWLQDDLYKMEISEEKEQ